MTAKSHPNNTYALAVPTRHGAGELSQTSLHCSHRCPCALEQCVDTVIRSGSWQCTSDGQLQVNLNRFMSMSWSTLRLFVAPPVFVKPATSPQLRSLLPPLYYNCYNHWCSSTRTTATAIQNTPLQASTCCGSSSYSHPHCCCMRCQVWH